MLNVKILVKVTDFQELYNLKILILVLLITTIYIMKINRLLVFVLGMLLYFPAQAQEQQLSTSETPQEIKTYIGKHFPDQQIVSVEKEKKYRGVEYEVELNDDTTVEFDEDFTPTKIDTDHRALPQDLVPKPIADYVSQNYPGRIITSWEKKYSGQEVELNDDRELLFSKDGKFKRADR